MLLKLKKMYIYNINDTSRWHKKNYQTIQLDNDCVSTAMKNWETDYLQFLRTLQINH